MSQTRTWPSLSPSHATWTHTSTRSLNSPTLSDSGETASDGLSESANVTVSPSDAITATEELRPPKLELTNTTVPFASWSEFVERQAKSGLRVDFDRVLEAKAEDGGFLIDAVGDMGRIAGGRPSLCVAFNADDDPTSTDPPSMISRYIAANVTVVVPPAERTEAMHSRGDGVARRVWIQFRGFTQDTKVGIFGPDPTDSVEASVPRTSRDVRVGLPFRRATRIFRRASPPFPPTVGHRSTPVRLGASPGSRAGRTNRRLRTLSTPLRGRRTAHSRSRMGRPAVGAAVPRRRRPGGRAFARRPASPWSPPAPPTSPRGARSPTAAGPAPF